RLFVTAVGMLVALANFKYESAVVLPEKDEDAHYIIGGGVLISLLFALVIWVFILFFEATIRQHFELKQGEVNYLFLIPLSVFFVSSYQCFNFYLIRKKAYKASARNKVYRRGSEAVVQSATGWLRYNQGLLFGSLIGDFVNFIGAFIQIKNQGFRIQKDFHQLKHILKQYWQFPIYHAFPSFLNTISLTLPVFIVHAAFGKAETGQFDLSRLVLSLPMALISTALSQVYLQHQAEKIRNKQSVASDFWSVSKALFWMSIPLALIVFLFATPLFSFIFGSQWALAGKLTAVLIFGQAIKFIVSPMSSTLVALKEVRFSAIWQLLYFGAMAWLYANPGSDIFDFALRYCYIDFAAYAFYYALIYKIVQRYEKARL
ncbi:MAG: lipopolysaccharide biosynthesis protein, partial [Sphingomonadales bacterium]